MGSLFAQNLQHIWIASQEKLKRRQAAASIRPSEAPAPQTPRTAENDKKTGGVDAIPPSAAKPTSQATDDWFARHRRRLALLCLIACTLFAVLWWSHHSKPPANTLTYEEATQSDSDVFQDAFKELESRAQKGDAKAQFELALNYANGESVPQDYAEALKWWHKAAEQGYVLAQLDLGFCYYEGQGVPQDFAEAFKWYRMAAEQMNAKAQLCLGICYYGGHGVPQDHAEAAKWYLMAAVQGDAAAQYDVGRCYCFGEGVPRDYAEASEWLLKSAEQGVMSAQSVLGWLYGYEEGGQLNYKEAVKWSAKAAEQGNASAQAELGRFYAAGLGVAEDTQEAARWFLRAAKQGDADAQFKLGISYYLGQGLPKNYVEAYKWYNLSSAQGNAKAQEYREMLATKMTPQMIAEGQRRSSVYVLKKEATAPAGENFLPKPGIVQGKVFTGTGFFVSDDGYLVTCEHVVHGAISFSIKTASGSIPARLVAKNSAIDIAVLKVSGTYPALPLAPNPQVKLGDSVLTIGFPNTDLQGVAPKLTKGEISSLSGIRDNPRYFQISVPVQPGNSGGALVDERGNVVGVVTSRLDDVATYETSGALPQNVNYAVKGGLVYKFLTKVPELSGKLKAPNTTKEQEAANTAAEKAAVLVIAE